MENAFNVGIENGGLRNITDIKMLISYVLSSIGEPMPKSDLIRSIIEDGLANYFDVTEALSSLTHSKTVIEKEFDGETYCEISPEESHLASEIETSVPFSVREKALNTAVMLTSHARNAKETDVEIFKSDNGYTVTCSVNNKDEQLFSVSLLVADELQANFVKDNFIKNPELVYSGALALLAGRSEIIADMIDRTKN
ncbi:MAG: DUF4364 family protein [Clostridia bacterium]|nr:DUF4364 family protein [Clostridia bacterium]